MQSQRKTQAGPYKGPQDLASLLNADEWSPTTLFPQPKSLDRIAFPPERPQPYMDLIKRLSRNGHPDLKYLWSELDRQNGGVHAERSRVAVLEYSNTGAPAQQLFATSKELEGYFSSSSHTSRNRLYILEEISTNYVEVFGSQFSIEPSFWAQHLRTTDRETSKTAAIVSALPSIRSLDTSFSLIYPEHTIIDDSEDKFTEEPRIRSAKSLFADCNLYRKITLSRPGEFYDGIAVVNRRASFWSRTNPGGSWDGLILVDPPIIPMEQKGDTTTQHFIYSHDFFKNKMMPIKISHHAPYQGGYFDFIPVEDSSHSDYTGPPRTSLFDDLIYYHTQLSPAPGSPHTPDTAVYFLKKIVAGIWMNSIAYVGTSVSSLEYAVEQSRKHSPSSTPADGKITSYGGLEWLEKNLFHIYGWKRRCSQLHDWTDWNLLELDISCSQLENCGSTVTSTSDIDQQDWLFIKKRLELCETCSRDIVASALGLLSLIESHKSVEEAESARVLALLGTVYLPLSLTAGILSMGGTFMPGQDRFWIFFVVAGPLMVLSLGATYMPMMGDFLSWAMRKGSTGNAGGMKRVPTFVKESQETV